MVRIACQVAYDQSPNLKRATSSDLTIEVVQVIAKHLTNNSRQDFTQRKAFMSLVKKVKQIIKLFKKAPEAWGKFKEMLGLTSSGLGLIKEIDKKLGDLLEEGKKKLASTSKKILNELPMLRLVGEVLEEQSRWEGLIQRYKNYVPESVRSGLAKIERGTAKLGDFLDSILAKSRILKALSAPIKIYLFFQIWDWFADFDLRIVTAGLLCTLSFSALVGMLPAESIEVILELILPPPANGALAKLVVEVGIASTMAVVLVLEVKYLMSINKVNTPKDLFSILEATI